MPMCISTISQENPIAEQPISWSVPTFHPPRHTGCFVWVRHPTCCRQPASAASVWQGLTSGNVWQPSKVKITSSSRWHPFAIDAIPQYAKDPCCNISRSINSILFLDYCIPGIYWVLLIRSINLKRSDVKMMYIIAYLTFTWAHSLAKTRRVVCTHLRRWHSLRNS